LRLWPRSLLACAWLGTAQAQAPPAEPGSEAAAPGRGTESPQTRPAQKLERVEISRDRDSEMRRNSSASRIVIGRDEIDRYGDSSIAETLRRLPGVTSGGRPGRGGEPRLRGMGGGYTQILVNGERMPPGFSLESLPPEQVERIEILRAPTAEYGARAVAGTINIVLREAPAQRLNELRLNLAAERGLLQPQLSLTRNDTFDGGAYNGTLTVNRNDRRDDVDNRSLVEDLATGATALDQHETGTGRSRHESLHLNGRLQWRPATGRSLELRPFAVASQSASDSSLDLRQSVGSSPPPYANAGTGADSRYSMLRVNAQAQQQFTEANRLELRGHTGASRWRRDSLRVESDADGAAVRRVDERTRSRDRSWSAIGKVAHRTSTAHSLLGGWEAEAASRSQRRTTLENGVLQAADLGEVFDASTRRLAMYLQDEFNAMPRIALSAGLRWERISTRSDGAETGVRNRSDVWRPLAHVLWRPREDARDQVRLSLTRGYRSPALHELIARPSISLRYPLPGGNIATSADWAGNPALKPEIARGIDLAYEKYLAQGGVFSANLFGRRIADLIRNLTALEQVPWAEVPRWVTRPRNVGGATVLGLELEAKFRLDEFGAAALPLSVNANAILFRSRVDSVPGPDNRIDQQPRATANLGIEYRPRALPLRLGGSVNWTPATTTRRSEEQTYSVSRKRVADAYALWLLDADTRLRLSVGNLLPRDFTTSNAFIAQDERQTSIGSGATHLSAAVRLEMKL
jgi:iron complex outermembrane receptor protein